jgi:hypothetical protein
MALAYVVTLEKELPELAAYTRAGSGKALARETERLDTAARTKKVEAITSMLSENPAALIAQMIEEGFDPARMRFPAEVWFSATDGLKSVRGLAEHVTANLNHFKQPNPILRDLKAVEALLIAAESAAVRFHFTKVNL